MNPLNLFSGIGELIKSVAGIFTPADKGKILDNQSRINEQEVAGAPVSFVRLWRSILMLALTVVVIFEVIVRPVIVTYWPDTPLPPSMLKDVLPIVIGNLGLGL